MTNTINTNNPVRNTAVSTGKTSDGANASGNNAASSGVGNDSDQLSLQSAGLAQQLSESVKSLPEVNQARVDAIKDALARGEYKPDPEQIARKFTEIESLLP